MFDTCVANNNSSSNVTPWVSASFKGLTTTELTVMVAFENLPKPCSVANHSRSVLNGLSFSRLLAILPLCPQLPPLYPTHYILHYCTSPSPPHIHSRLNYCNSLCHSLPVTKIIRLQQIQDALARALTSTPKVCTHHSQHWNHFIGSMSNSAYI